MLSGRPSSGEAQNCISAREPPLPPMPPAPFPLPPPLSFPFFFFPPRGLGGIGVDELPADLRAMKPNFIKWIIHIDCVVQRGIDSGTYIYMNLNEKNSLQVML
jgi:hypothetical protein